MKTDLNNSSAPVTGRRYWRSLDELADTPEFKDWLHREFPSGASEMEDGQSRRSFLKLMSASFALAGIATLGAGCRRPEEKLEPFGKQLENYTFGEAQYFATAMPTRTGAVPLAVKSYEGRPVKIEGNALYPNGNGGTDRYAQASILDLYDPDRARHFKKLGADGKLDLVTREEALGFLDGLAKKFAANEGEGLAFLAESSTSPSRARLQKIIAQKYPKAQWFTHDAIDSGIHQRAATRAFGQSVRPVFNFDKAKVILSLDCDFLGGEDDAHNHIRKFVAGRKADTGMSRLYAVESLFTLTGASADHRLRFPASSVGNVAYEILSQIAGGSESMNQWVSECAKDLVKNRGSVLVVAGQRQPVEVHLVAHAINTALDSIGTTVTLLPAVETSKADLSNLDANASDTLVILGGNPAYNLNWSPKSKSTTVVRLGYYEDETANQANWNFPAAHYLESWGDATTSDGSLVPIQPLIQPLFGGLNELEFLARLAGEAQAGAHEIVQSTFGSSEASWKKFLYNGYTPVSQSPVTNVRVTETLRSLGDIFGKKKAPVSANNLEVIFFRDAKVDDGRYANNGWMQELPDPVTKMTWDNAVLISRKTARDLGVANGDVVEITVNGKSVTGPIWTQPGMADNSLGLALGYGRERAGRVGDHVGFNAYKIFNGEYVATGATIKKTGATYTLACTQHHWSMEGRPAVREFNLAETLEAKENIAEEKFHGVEPPIVQSLYPNPLDEAKKTALHQWGMSIDLSACVGCGTCVIACQSENNIPIVGKDQVLRGREMHWMRIDRYFTSDPKRKNNPSRFKLSADMNQSDENQQFAEWIDDVQAVNQPMLCQMCETAPCENVCPVAATVHDQEGLNVMAYNRCIGTRYCSNNCPYKVRRFNFLDYNKRPLTELKGTLYSTTLTHKTDGEWDLKRWWNDPNSGMRTEDEWDLIKLSKNPDATVRMRGVMEKCTYCTQRIEHAKIGQKAKAGASDNVRLTEAAGTVPKTACQQACPAGAIVFGDISDADSSVSKLKLSTLNYSVLGDLLTRPRTTYLARVRNPNILMPDYIKDHDPFSTEEYESQSLTKKGQS
ncbi:MAG TPA: TAT-variant-translocated molybdopterin oxidoreductase [Candidatus Acidoferrales bacterium]|jgi:MoCo/4Fe-4S cofactor protein with predicted Tat translocation signal|nr:TAT-variant-translocated molybdopterin oxidoreductase [Candidatus Acidoferrales bacterium]